MLGGSGYKGDGQHTRSTRLRKPVALAMSQVRPADQAKIQGASLIYAEEGNHVVRQINMGSAS